LTLARGAKVETLHMLRCTGANGRFGSEATFSVSSGHVGCSSDSDRSLQ